MKGINRAADLDIEIGLIGLVQKTLSLKDADWTTDFIVEYADDFVALDFADKDTHDLRSYVPMVAKARTAGLHLTTHAGEEPVNGASQEVRSAVEDLGADRIGHGIHIINDGDVIDLVRSRNVALEVCPTSNWLTSSVSSTAAHPIRKLMEVGVPVTINSDDPGLFGIDLCNEYEILHREHGFTEEEFDRCNDIAAAQSFLPQEQKERVWPRDID